MGLLGTVLELGVGGVGTRGWHCWNWRRAVLEPGSVVVVVLKLLNASIDELAFEMDTEQYHKSEVFRL
jgi:hypothetical protein